MCNNILWFVTCYKIKQTQLYKLNQGVYLHEWLVYISSCSEQTQAGRVRCRSGITGWLQCFCVNCHRSVHLILTYVWRRGADGCSLLYLEQPSSSWFTVIGGLRHAAGETGEAFHEHTWEPRPSLYLPVCVQSVNMAAATISIEEDQFCCSVCLEVLRDPVTIPCGHSYCLDCIEDYWNRPKQKGQYSCPQCRQVFNPRPLLSRNTVLGEVVGKFQQSGSHLQGVRCSVCTGRKSKAVKSCLACSESYCAAHLRAHEESFHGKRHKLIPASDQLRDEQCSQHEKLLRLFCRTDQQYVCSQCVKERHKGHNAVSVVEERAAQQVGLILIPTLLKCWTINLNVGEVTCFWTAWVAVK